MHIFTVLTIKDRKTKSPEAHNGGMDVSWGNYKRAPTLVVPQKGHRIYKSRYMRCLGPSKHTILAPSRKSTFLNKSVLEMSRTFLSPRNIQIAP